jgi:hypothetical protein
VARLTFSRLVSIVISVYYRFVDLALECAAGSIVFFASYDAEFIEVIYHETVSGECFVDCLSVI